MSSLVAGLCIGLYARLCLGLYRIWDVQATRLATTGNSEA
jgi:hypothetical protein